MVKAEAKAELAIEAMEHRIVVKPITVKQSAGGILLPDGSKLGRAAKGEVLSVGPGRMLECGIRCPMDVRKGDVVLYDAYSPTEFEHDGEKYHILGNDQILGRLPEGK